MALFISMFFLCGIRIFFLNYRNKRIFARQYPNPSPAKARTFGCKPIGTHADRTAHEDIPAVSGSETGRKRGIRGKATGPASSDSRCKPDEESRKTGCNGPLGTSAERKTRRNGQNGSERPGRSLRAEFAGTASARPSESAPSPISGQNTGRPPEPCPRQSTGLRKKTYI